MPAFTAAGLLALYLACGFFALPALVKWQIEKQAPEKLGHQISIKAVRFNPLVFTFEIDDLALADPEGRPMLGFKRLFLDFELRSVIDRAWTFAQVSLEAPELRVELDHDGRHNFTALLERLRDKEPKEEAAALPRFVVKRLLLADGRTEFSDSLLATPLLARIAPLSIEVADLSSLPGDRGRFRLSARSAEGETLETSGDLALSPATTKGRLTLNGIRVATLARSLSRLAAIDAPAGTVDLETGFSLQAGAGGEGARIELDQPKLSISGAHLGRGADTLDLPAAAIETVSVTMVATDRSFGLTLLAPRVAAPGGLSVRQGEAALKIGSLNVKSSRLALDQADASAGGAIDDLKLAAAGVSATGSGYSAQLGDVSLESKQIALKLDANRLNLDLADLSSALAGLQATHQTDGVKLRTAKLGSKGLSLVQADGRTRVAASALAATLIGVDAGKGPDRLTIEDASFEARALKAAAGQGSAPAEATLEDAALRLASVGLRALGAKTEIGRVANARFGAAALALSLPLSLPNGPAELTGSGLNATLTEGILRNPADATELLRLGSATLAGGALRLKDRVVSADKFALARGTARLSLDAQGRFNWLSLFKNTTATDAGAAKPQQTSRWRLALKSAQLDDFSAGFRDSRASPAFALNVQTLRARVSDLNTGSAVPMQLEFRASLASGGQIGAKGKVRADTWASDLDIDVARLALAPLQTYLSEFAGLRLAAGTASAAGRLRYGDPAAAGAKLAYKGSASIDRMLLEEIAPKRPFLSWESIGSSDVELTLQPDRADIGELRIDRPSGRLIIAADHTVNLTDVLKQGKARDGARKDAASTPAAPRKEDGDPFPISIARVRVADGALEFADLSLRPQFATRMHELKGVISGLSSDAGRAAKLQLDARVDRHGSAKISGQISALRPEKRTEIDVAFRNLELTSLSPYIAKFAGYSIEGGQLALDLEYRVRDGKLLGENKIVLKQVVLGEKVDSPNALDLPLELALAVLKDANGVIDIGLPVSGDLSDPKFDYGAIIGKAIGNLLGNIVTAPFRALGALFGGAEEKLDSIDFEPGSDTIAPPERQKLEAVARALAERPALMLVVPPTSAADADTRALKSLAVRRDIVRRMGIELKAGEDPGPVDGANPRIQRAIEAAFSQRYSAAILDALKDREIRGATQPPRLPAAFFQRLADRMILEEPVSEQMLAALAARRGAAIVRALTVEGGVPAARVKLGEPRAALAASDQAVTLQLKLEVAK